ncbi:MAG: ABC transporter substrate-binding protein [Burkholderiaceae bacterium]|nr:ABC transporter substrate-binding protein [Burkholderiaceae bacterium]
MASLLALAGPYGAAWGRTSAPRRIGVLAPSTAEREATTLKPFFDEMERLGWHEGEQVRYDRTYAGNRHEDLPRLAAELVRRRPELIYAPPSPAAVAAKGATAVIPIVFATATDPVGTGLVQSLARPGGNVTGICSVMDSLAPKSLELLQQLFPALQRVGLLGERQDARLRLDREALTPLLAARGMQLVLGEATNPQGVDAAVERLLRARAEVVLTNSSLTFNLRDRLAERFRAHRVALVGHRAEMVEAGALFSYGASLPDQLRASALVVDRVLKGARPADIPVEQPTRFELALNMATARALGVEVPPTVRLRAERVVE